MLSVVKPESLQNLKKCFVDRHVTRDSALPKVLELIRKSTDEHQDVYLKQLLSDYMLG